MPILFRTPLSVDRKGSQKTPDSSFLLQGAPIPSLPSLYTAGAFMLLKSSFPFVRAASTPTPFSCRPPSCSKPLCPPQTGSLCSNSGSRELVAWRAPTWEPAGEAATLCLPGPPPPSTQPHVAQPPAGPLHPNFLGRRKSGRQQAAKIKEGSGGAERCPAGSQDPPSTCSRSKIAEKQRHGAPMAGRAGAEQTRSSGAVRQGRVRPGWSLAELPKSSRPHRCSPLH